MAKTEAKQLTRNQRHLISSMLEAALNRISDKTVEYRDNHSDASIAARAGATEMQVRKLRSEWFGNLKTGGFDGVKYGELVTMVTKLEARVATLEARLGASGRSTVSLAATDQARNVPINGHMR